MYHHCFPGLHGYIPREFANRGRSPALLVSRSETQNMFITPAYAQAAGSQPDMLVQLAPFAIILVIMYFLILRPQQKRAKAQQEMISNIRRGDTVITSGGIIGKVTKATDDAEIEVEIAPDTRVRLVRGMIVEVRAKGEPVKEG